MSNRTLYQAGRYAMKLCARLMLQMDIVHEAGLPDGPKIIAPNHPTTLDPFLIPTLIAEQVHILVTESAFNVPVLGRYLWSAGHIPVVTGSGHMAFEAAKTLLMDGQSVVIFPEGALSPLNGRLCKPHTGVARLALVSGAPVIPVGIHLQYDRIRFVETTIKGQSEIARWYFHGPYSATVGKPMHIGGDVEDRDYVVAISERIMRRILRLSQQSAYRLTGLAPAVPIRDTAEIPSLN